MPVTPLSITLKGKKYTRQEYLRFRDKKVKCAPYDDHWLYETNDIGPRYRCTCGSPAVVIEMGQGVLFVCQYHTDNGCHTTGGRRWI